MKRCKLIALLLAVILCLQCLPVYATQTEEDMLAQAELIAQEMEAAVPETEEQSAKDTRRKALRETRKQALDITESVDATLMNYGGLVSGTCGAEGDGGNLTWVFDNGTLTIEGTGAMADYENTGSTPWMQYTDRITALILPDGLTTIGDYAFAHFYGLLNAISIPKSVTEIGEYAFYNSYKMAGELILPENLVSVGDYAFCDCSKLRGTLTLPASLQSLGDGAFGACYFDAIRVESGSTALCVEDGVLYTKDMTRLIAAPGTLEEVPVIPGTVTTIAPYAFYECCEMEGALTLPQGLISIGEHAFDCCCELEGTLILPEGLISIGEGAFSYCSLEGTLTLPASLQTLGAGAFTNNSEFDAFRVAEGSTGFCALDGNLYTKDMTCLLAVPCSRRTIPEIPASVTHIAEEAMAGCSMKGWLIIPETVKSVADWAVASCSSLYGICFVGNAPEVDSYIRRQNDEYYITTEAFGRNALLYYLEGTTGWTDGEYYDSNAGTWYGYTLNIWDGNAENIVPGGTCGDTLTWSVSFKDGTLTIEGSGDMEDYGGDSAPWYSLQSAITSLSLSDDMTSIGNSAFCDCYNLTGELTLPKGLTTIGDYAFAYCSLEGYLVIPETVASIGSRAFYYSGFSGICFMGNAPAVGSSISEAPLYYQEGKTGWTDGEYYDSNAGTWYGYTLNTWDGDAGNIGKKGVCGESLTWTLSDDGVLTIEGAGDMYDYLHRGAPWRASGVTVTKVIFPDGLTSIGNYAFWNLLNLETPEFPDTLREIGDQAFAACWELDDILTLPASLETLGAGAFAGCEFEEIVVAEGNTHFCAEDNIIYNADKTTLVAVGYREDCPTIPDTVTRIEDGAFLGCEDMSGYLILPASVKYIGEEAFYECEELTGVYFMGAAPEAWELDGGDSFFEDTVLHYIKGKDGWPASDSWNGYTLRTWDGYAENIGKKGVCGESLTWTLSDDGVLTIEGTGDMYDYTSETIPWYTSRKNIEILRLPAGLTRIGNYAFYSCTALSELTGPVSLMGDYVGDTPSNPVEEKLTLPESLISIGNCAFYNCRQLRDELVLPEGLVDIGTRAFDNCGLGGTLTLPASVKKIGVRAFEDCWRLDAFHVAEGNTAFCAEDGILYNTTKTELLIVPSGMVDVPVIPSSVETIAAYAMVGCEFEGWLIIPEKVARFGERSIYDTYLYGICFMGNAPASVIGADEKYASLEDSVLYYLEGKTGWTDDEEAYDPDVGTWNGYDLELWTGNTEDIVLNGICGDDLTWSLSFDTKVLTIDGSGDMYDYDDWEAPWAYYQSAIFSLSLSDAITSIGNGAFSDCYNLTGELILPGGLTAIGEYAFAYSSLEGTLIIPETVTSIGGRAFYGSDLSGIYFMGNAPTVGSRFSSCPLYYLEGKTGWTDSINYNEEEGTWCDCTLKVWKRPPLRVTEDRKTVIYDPEAPVEEIFHTAYVAVYKNGQMKMLVEALYDAETQSLSADFTKELPENCTVKILFLTERFAPVCDVVENIVE